MKILVVGSGGRDHAIAYKFTQSPRVKKVFVAPGNAGIAETAECVNAREPEEIAAFAEKEKIDLTFVGPENPLSSGIVDLFEKKGLKIVGPNLKASRLETSKCDTKELLKDLGVPVPEFAVFADPAQAKEYVKNIGYPVVVKADGLAAGKGSLVCDDVAQAEQAVTDLMEKKVFGDAGNRVDIEKRLYGRELSFFCFTDGETVLPMEAALDYKRSLDNDEGLNTGGMGSYSPHPWLTPALSEQIMNEVARPVIQGLREKHGITYRGIIYFGLMLVQEGSENSADPKEFDETKKITPYVLEINIRLGDPEAQVILPRLKNDLVDISEAILEGRLKDIKLEWDPQYYLCLIATSGRLKGKKGWYKGYPQRYKIGVPITGLDQLSPETLVFHSGTAKNEEGQFITTGGRVVCLITRGDDLETARQKAYQEMEKIDFPGIAYRQDIGKN